MHQDPLLPLAEDTEMLFWKLAASGQISMRKIDGSKRFPAKPLDQQTARMNR